MINVNQPIDDYDLFTRNMNEKGYNKMTDKFLVKRFNSSDGEIEINIGVSKSNSIVQTISAYENSEILNDIPQDILDQVRNDIDSSLL